METVTNVAGTVSTTISNAIWGTGSNPNTESGTEPINGQQGKGNVNEPFDKGNEETGNTGVSDFTSANPDRNTVPSSGVDTSASNRTGPSEATSGPETGDPKSAQQPEQKQQGADRPHESPEDKKDGIKMPHSDEEREKLVMKGEFPHDPNDHSGEPLHMHGGAKKEEDTTGENDAPAETGGKKDRSASVAQEGGNPHGKEMGTGQQVVKTSGMNADGGDFDATKPGAGSEATRLMEAKGVHKAVGNKGPPAEAADASETPEKAKTSKITKIKEKLHIGSNKA